MTFTTMFCLGNVSHIETSQLIGVVEVSAQSLSSDSPSVLLSHEDVFKYRQKQTGYCCFLHVVFAVFKLVTMATSSV